MRAALVAIALAFAIPVLAQDAIPVPPLPDGALRAPKLTFERKPVDLQYVVPTCHCQVQCEAMWAKAVGALESASNMRIRLATDTLLDTYVPTTIGYAHGRAIKAPDGRGAYTIRATFQADPRLPDAEMAAFHMFNAALQDPATLALCTEPKSAP